MEPTFRDTDKGNRKGIVLITMAFGLPFVWHARMYISSSSLMTTSPDASIPASISPSYDKLYLPCRNWNWGSCEGPSVDYPLCVLLKLCILLHTLGRHYAKLPRRTLKVEPEVVNGSENKCFTCLVDRLPLVAAN